MISYGICLSLSDFTLVWWSLGPFMLLPGNPLGQGWSVRVVENRRLVKHWLVWFKFYCPLCFVHICNCPQWKIFTLKILEHHKSCESLTVYCRSPLRKCQPSNYRDFCLFCSLWNAQNPHVTRHMEGAHYVFVGWMNEFAGRVKTNPLIRLKSSLVKRAFIHFPFCVGENWGSCNEQWDPPALDLGEDDA